MHFLAHPVGQPANRKNIRRAIECDAIVEVETLCSKHFFGNRGQARVIRLEGVTEFLDFFHSWPLCL